MIEYKLNTNLLNELMCMNLYDSILGGADVYQRAHEDAQIDEVEDYEVVFDEKENLRCVRYAFERLIKDVILPYLKQFGVDDIRIGGWYHPKEYNFQCDRLDLFFYFSDSFFETAMRKVEDWIKWDNSWNEIEAYIEHNFKSRECFISLMPESLVELLVDLKMTKTLHAVAAYITLLLYEEFGDEALQEKLEDFYQDEACKTEIAYYIQTSKTNKQ